MRETALHSVPRLISDTALDRWVRRLLWVTMVMLAAGLIGLGVALYAPEAQASAQAKVRESDTPAQVPSKSPEADLAQFEGKQ